MLPVESDADVHRLGTRAAQLTTVIQRLTRLVANDGRPLLLAIALHALLLLLLLSIDMRQPVVPRAVEPIQTYLYQAPKLPPPTLAPTPTLASAPLAEAAAAGIPAVADVTAAGHASPEQDSSHPLAPEPDRAELTAAPAVQTTVHSAVAVPGLAQRAFNRAATIDPVAIEQAATAGYQQFLQVQQQPKLTVEKRHQSLSQNPAHQVVAQLNDGKQLVRVKGGCRLADPTKQGFDALMAAKVVSCGDEDDSSALLKRALQKHSKR